MMRNVGKKIKIEKYVEVEEVITKEQITAINIYPEDKKINLTIMLINESNKAIREEMKVFSGDDYALLFSNDPLFEEGKQEGSYREIDLWKMIDKLTD